MPATETELAPGSRPDPGPPADRPAGDRHVRERVDRPDFFSVRATAPTTGLTWVDAAAAVLGTAQVAGYLVVALGGTLYQDDIRLATRTVPDPWSLDWILAFGEARHFAPLVRAWHSGLVTFAPLNSTVAFAASAGLLVAFTAALWILLRRLAGPNPAALAGFAISVLMPLGLVNSVWNIQAVSALPVMLGGVLAAHGVLGLWRSMHLRWLGLVAGGLLLGAVTWEKWIALPPILVLFAACALPTTFRPRAVTGVLLRLWPAWLTTAVIVAAYLPLWWFGDYDTDAAPPTIGAAAAAWGRAVSELVVPSLAGGPWAWSSDGGYTFYPPAATPAWGVAAAAAALAVVLTVVARAAPGSVARAVVLSVGSCTVVVIPPLLGRLSQFGDTIAVTPRYLVDVVPWLAVAVTIVVAGWKGAHRPLSRLATAALAVGVVLVVGGSLVTQVQFARIWWSNPAIGYLDRARDGLAHLPEGSALFDTEVPAGLVNRYLFSPHNVASETLLPLVHDRDITFGRSNSAWMVDGTGGVVPAGFEVKSVAPTAECVPVAGPGQGWTRVDLPSPLIHTDQLTIHLTLESERPVQYRVATVTDDTMTEAGSSEDPSSGLWLAQAGTNDAFVLAPPSNVDAVAVSAESADSGLCMRRVELGTPVPRDAAP
ncbi:MAG: hypothetical protein R2737_11340 [Candidatus Nanopelagicales bacterium]